jgi:hypothetical protein
MRFTLRDAWLRATRGPEDQPPAQRRRTRILLSIVLSMMLRSIGAFVVVPFLVAATSSPADRYARGVVTPILIAIFLLVMIVAWALGRTGRYLAAALLIVGMNLLDSYAAMIVTGNVFFLATLSFSDRAQFAGRAVAGENELERFRVVGAVEGADTC